MWLGSAGVGKSTRPPMTEFSSMSDIKEDHVAWKCWGWKINQASETKHRNAIFLGKANCPMSSQSGTNALWSGINKNRDVSTGPLARPFTRSLVLLTRSLAPDCSPRSRPLLRSLVRSLAHFAHSLARGTVNDWIIICSVFLCSGP